MLQQGDVLLKEIDLIPTGAKKVVATERGYVLAYGETTGHAHVVMDIEHADMFEKDGVLYLSVNQPVLLTHEEHGVVEIPVGIREVDIVREYDYFAEMTRRVVD